MKQKIILKFKLKEVVVVFFLFFLTLGIRLPLFGTPFWATPDAIEYINVANQINEGNGFTQTIKWNFFSNSPVITSALEGKPILTSLVFAGWLSVFKNTYSLQLLIFLMLSVNVVLFYILLRHFSTVIFSFIGAFILSTNPNIFISNRLVLSEPIFYFFVILAFIAFYKLRENIIKYFLIGIFTSLAYLTRTEGIFLLLAFSFSYLKSPKKLLALITSFTVFALPYFYLNYLVNNNPFYSYTVSHFKVFHFSEGMNSGFNKTFLPATDFIYNNFNWIIKTIFRNFYENIFALIDFSFLGFLFIPLLWIIKYYKKFFPIILFCVFDIVNYSIVWSQFFDPERHLSTVFILLLIPIIYLIGSRSINSKMALVILFTTLLIYGAFDLHRINWSRINERNKADKFFESNKELYGYIISKTDKKSIVASSDPWLTYLYTKRPSILLPDNLNNNRNINEYISDFKINYVVAVPDKNSFGKKILQTENVALYKTSF